MVQECYKYVDAMTDLDIKLRLIDTLRTVTAGKVWILCVITALYDEISENLCRFQQLSVNILLNSEQLGQLEHCRLIIVIFISFSP